MRTIRNRIKGLAQIHHSRIRPHPKNWRTHPEAQRKALRGVFADLGIIDTTMVRPVEEEALALLRAIDRRDVMGFYRWFEAYTGDFLLLDGHLRVEELQQYGDGTIDALVLDLEASEEGEVLLTLDALSAMAGADADRLGELRAVVQSEQDGVQHLLAELGEVESRARREQDAMVERALGAHRPAATENAAFELPHEQDGDGEAVLHDPRGAAVDKTKLQSLRFGKWKLPMSQADVDRLEAHLAAYTARYGSSYGFLTRVVECFTLPIR